MKRILFLAFIYSLNFSCSGGGGGGTGTTSTTDTTTTCTINSSAVSTTLVQSASWTLTNSNLSNLVANVDITRFSSFLTNSTSCNLIFEMSIVNGAYPQLSSSQQSTYVYSMQWTDIGVNATNNFYNLNLSPDSGFGACLRARVLNTQVVSDALCKTFRVPNYIPPSTVYCSPLSIRRITYFSTSPIEYNTCTPVGATPNRQYTVADTSMNILKSWQFLSSNNNNISLSGITSGLTYKLLTKTANGDGYESAISSKDFYYPKPVTLNLKFKSKSSFDPTIYTCQIAANTFDTSINTVKSNYATCSLVQNSTTVYTIDCTGIQTCLSNAACTALNYVRTDYSFCTSSWAYPTLDLQTDY